MNSIRWILLIPSHKFLPSASPTNPKSKVSSLSNTAIAGVEIIAKATETFCLPIAVTLSPSRPRPPVVPHSVPIISTSPNLQRCCMKRCMRTNEQSYVHTAQRMIFMPTKKNKTTARKCKVHKQVLIRAPVDQPKQVPPGLEEAERSREWAIRI